MYLLMLLATFMASIYGYNLSARPDYDRNVVRKKAAAVVFKFNNQFNALQKLAEAVYRQDYESDGLAWVLPGDMMYSDEGAETETFYKQGNPNNPSGSGSATEISLSPGYLLSGRQVYDYTEMATKIICLGEGKELQENDATDCTPDADDDGNITGTCCSSSEQKFIISYKKLDARWINRVSGDVSFDFISALTESEYYENIGVIHWENGAWQFRGKINFRPVYTEDEKVWRQQHQDDLAPYPTELRTRSTWTMPKFFTQGYFTTWNGSGNGTQVLCKKGQPCLVKIQFL